jgi:hypothetical protein
MITLLDRPGTTDPDNDFGDSSNASIAYPIVIGDSAPRPAEAMGGGCGDNGIVGLDCHRWFTPETSPSAIWAGSSALGDWTLTVSDNFGGDVGTINRWSLDANTNHGIGKDPKLANLWLCNQGGPAGDGGCFNKDAGVEQVNFDVNLNDRIVGFSKGEPQALGSFEFEVRYDSKYVSVDVEAGSLFDRDGVECQSIDTENAVWFSCLTKGKPESVPAEINDLASVVVRPTADVYSILIANQENGIATQLINQDCQLADLQGHDINIDATSCNDSAVTIRYLEGDIHADCIVDVLDQQQIAFRWGSHLGNLLYNSRMDLEPSAPKKGDGDIDAKDLQFVFGRHGSSCKDPHPAQDPVDPKAKPPTEI